MSELFEFLPVSKEDMESRGWWWYDFLIVTGDAYVDHPSFGPTVIARVLEAEGYRVAILAQPDWHSADAFLAMGRPRLGAMLCSGNLDSMVAHYTAAKKPRSEDFYSPGKKAGLRPDHAVIVYANRVREAFPGLPIVIGGLEASLRRFAHYDYWDDKVRRSALADAGADIAKLAVMPRCAADAARLLEATARAADTRPDTPLITMSMGPLGAVTRFCGGAFGSCATFGVTSGTSASAPGQPSADLLKAKLITAPL